MDKSPVDSEAGIGRVVELTNEMTVLEIINLIKSSLGVKNLRYAGDLNEVIKKIAIVNGSGQDFFGDAKKNWSRSNNNWGYNISFCFRL